MYTYEPLYKLKEYDNNIWVVDGGIIRLFNIPFPTRMTIIKLNNNDLFSHSPIHLTKILKKKLLK